MITAQPAVKQRDPLHVLAVLARRKGDVFAYTTGQPQSFLVNRPEYVKHVLVDRADHYSKDTPMHVGFETTIARGVLTSEGDVWLRQRRLMQPAFARRNTPAAARVVAREVDSMFDAWRTRATADGSLEINLHAETTRLLFRITCIALFHVDPRPWDGRMTEILAGALPVLTDEGEYPFVVAQHAIWDIAERIVQQRLDSDLQVPDVLGRLIASDSPEAAFSALRDHVVTMALSGYETTASVVTWGCYLLARHPSLATRLRSEMRSVTGDCDLALEHLPRLPYLNAVIRETMRLYPPAWIIGRKALDDDRIGDTDIPAQSVVAISPYTLHRHPRYWPEPEVFAPERFMDADAEERRQPYTYIPFGAGPRTCIGTNFAQVEAPLILGRLVQRYEMTLRNEHDVLPQGIFVLIPSEHIRMQLAPAV